MPSPSGWPLNTSPPVAPSNVGTTPPPAGQPNTNWLIAFGEYLIKSIIAQIAIALGGIDIGGFEPLAFLKTWGENLETQATQAFQTATAAQNTANTTNTTIVNSVTGSNASTQPAETVGPSLAALAQAVAAASAKATQAYSAVSQFVANGATTVVAGAATVFTDAEQLAGAGLAWLESWFGITTTTQGQTVANATAIAAQQAQLLAAGTTGNYDGDLFNYTGPLNPAIWSPTNTGAGGVQVNGTDAYWATSGAGAATEFDLFTRTQTQTDYQIIWTVLDNPTSQAGAHRRLIGRCDLARQNFVFCEWGSGQMIVYKVIGGAAPVQIGSAVAYTEHAADTIAFAVGNPAGAQPYEHTVLVNGSGIMAVNETSSFSVLGANNRYTAQYWSVAAGVFGFPAEVPGNVHSFYFADAAPPTVPGSSACMARVNTSNVLVGAGNTAVIPSSFFDTIVYNSSDIAINLPNNSFTVSKSGIYTAKIRSKFTTAGTTSVYPVIFVQPASGANAIRFRGPATGITGAGTWWWGDTFPGLLLNAGDIVTFGFFTGPNGINFYGDGSQTETYATLSRTQ